MVQPVADTKAGKAFIIFNLFFSPSRLFLLKNSLLGKLARSQPCFLRDVYWLFIFLFWILMDIWLCIVYDRERWKVRDGNKNRNSMYTWILFIFLLYLIIDDFVYFLASVTKVENVPGTASPYWNIHPSLKVSCKKLGSEHRHWIIADLDLTIHAIRPFCSARQIYFLSNLSV